MQNLAKAYDNLTGDMLIAAGVIAYLGAFTAAYRTSITATFVEMCRWASSCLNQTLDPGNILAWTCSGHAAAHRDFMKGC